MTMDLQIGERVMVAMYAGSDRGDEDGVSAVSIARDYVWVPAAVTEIRDMGGLTGRVAVITLDEAFACGPSRYASRVTTKMCPVAGASTVRRAQ